MVFVITLGRKPDGKKGINIEEISPEELGNLRTLKRWRKQNPKVWKQIRYFVLNKNLHKKPSEHREKKPRKKKEHPILG